MKDEQFEEQINSVFKDNIVLHGPFKGMRYPQRCAIGSELYPKLLGSYESELSNIIHFILKQNYSTVVDIGCAEGYYAVGIGMNMPDAHIIGYDTNKKALALCHKMAQLNGVVSIETAGLCTQDTIRSLNLKKKSLIISDCEGYEKTLFSESLCEELRCHDLLIECHDFMNIEITPQLLERLSKTHTVEVIKSIDDISKVYEYDYPELKHYKLSGRRKILSELRPQIMRWIFAKTHTT